MSTSPLLDLLVPPPLHADIWVSLERAAVWKKLVPLGSDLVFDLRWQPGILLQLRLISSKSYDAWSRGDRQSVEAWATVFGNGAIRGSLAPPWPDWWNLSLQVPVREGSTPAPPAPTPIIVRGYVAVAHARSNGAG